MSFLETSHVAEGPFGSNDPLADLVEYFQTNGYEVVQSTLGPRPTIMTWKADDEEPAPNAIPVEDANDEEPEASSLPAIPAEDDTSEGDDDDRLSVTRPNDAKAEDEPAEIPSITEHNDDDDQEIIVRTQLRRGTKGASIWSSNMAELLSDVDIKVIGNSIRFAYTVETTLQRFNEDDNAFWAHEAKQAIRVATGGKAIDWRDNEAIRVSRQQKDIIMIGVQLAFITAILVAVAYFAFDRI